MTPGGQRPQQQMPRSPQGANAARPAQGAPHAQQPGQRPMPGGQAAPQPGPQRQGAQPGQQNPARRMVTQVPPANMQQPARRQQPQGRPGGQRVLAQVQKQNAGAQPQRQQAQQAQPGQTHSQQRSPQQTQQPTQPRPQWAQQQRSPQQVSGQRAPQQAMQPQGAQPQQQMRQAQPSPQQPQPQPQPAEQQVPDMLSAEPLPGETPKQTKKRLKKAAKAARRKYVNVFGMIVAMLALVPVTISFLPWIEMTDALDSILKFAGSSVDESVVSKLTIQPTYTVLGLLGLNGTLEAYANIAGFYAAANNVAEALSTLKVDIFIVIIVWGLSVISVLLFSIRTVLSRGMSVLALAWSCFCMAIMCVASMVGTALFMGEMVKGTTQNVLICLAASVVVWILALVAAGRSRKIRERDA